MGEHKASIGKVSLAAKKILHSAEARARLGVGVNGLANAVKLTLGPRGRNVGLAQAHGPPIITKDGAMVADGIEFSDRFAHMGALLIREAAFATAAAAGDGTTTATVLAQAIYAEGMKLITAGIDPMALGRGIALAVTAVVEDLKRQSKAVSTENEIAEVATLSASGDETAGKLIANAMQRVGKNGVVLVEAGTSTETTLDVTLGLEFERGYLSPYFVTDQSHMKVTLSKPYVLVYEGRLLHAEPLMPLLEKIAAAERPLLLIADVSGEALTTLVTNSTRGSLNVCAVMPPGFGDARQEGLEDIATLLGTLVVHETSATLLAQLELNDLGAAESVTVDRKTTLIVGGTGETQAIRGRVNQVQNELSNTDSGPRAAALQLRLARLTGGVATIKVGGFTEVEVAEKRARYEDAMHAARAAIKEGIVAGGGLALVLATPAIAALQLFGVERLGAEMMGRAIQEPLRRIAHNAGQEGAAVLEQVLHSEPGVGYNAANGEFEDLISVGVVDPTQVVRIALVNAASVATMLLTTAVCIADSSKAPSAAWNSEASA